MNYAEIVAPVEQFLHCQTPQAWIEEAKKPHNLPLILIDHMICELKAAQTAMYFLRKYVAAPENQQELLSWLAPYEAFVYRHQGDLSSLSAQNHAPGKQIFAKTAAPENRALIDKLVPLIKEELHHFYQVLEIMHARNIPYENLSAGNYAKSLMRHVRTHEPATLVDKLICGAYIEARSCERFYRLAPFVDETLREFYYSLLRSEARHYADYLALAALIQPEKLEERVNYFGQVEAALILRSDALFRFHSGIPAEE